MQAINKPGHTHMYNDENVYNMELDYLLLTKLPQ